MRKIDYGEVYSASRIDGKNVLNPVKCFYKNNSLGVVAYMGTLYKGKAYRIVILGDGRYKGMHLDFLYPRTIKKAVELADELDNPDWLCVETLPEKKKSELYNKLRSVYERQK